METEYRKREGWISKNGGISNRDSIEVSSRDEGTMEGVSGKGEEAVGTKWKVGRVSSGNDGRDGSKQKGEILERGHQKVGHQIL